MRVHFLHSYTIAYAASAVTPEAMKTTDLGVQVGDTLFEVL